MTVKELKALLDTFPQDVPVLTLHNTDDMPYWDEPYEVKLEDYGYMYGEYENGTYYDYGRNGGKCYT